LAAGQSPTAVYTGPVYVLTASGVVLYRPAITPSNTVDGGAKASATTLAAKFPDLLVPGNTAEIVHGLAAPENAPAVVQEIIWTANRIIGRPYVFGGGHQSFISRGYDCSGTVSFALHGGHLLKAPLASGQFERWGMRGQGLWMTILTNAGHAYLDIAGLRLDTSTENDPSNLQGPRWRPLRPYNTGFIARHPAEL
jgi:cell wall-associated NlpC family hydrolase